MSNRHLLAVEIGPVQEMIVAARKTRDLWFSSYLVSEVAKAAARGLAEKCGSNRLIFPAPEKNDDLQSGSSLAVADVLLVEVPEDIEPADVGNAAKTAVEEHWKKYAEEAFEAARGDVFLDKEVWDTQVNDVFECYAAWVPLGENYREARSRVMQLLAGRTMCRNFEPAAVVPGRSLHPGRPKSSLDGARDSVLKQYPTSRKQQDQKTKKTLREHREIHLRLATGEQLDCVGVTKRLGEGKRPYPSVARLAADPWLRGIAKTPGAREDFDRLLAACASLAKLDIISRIDPNIFPQYEDFPYEGAVVFPNRHHELAEEAGFELSTAAQLPDEMRELREALMRLIQHPKYRFGEPDPYLAVIVADGDQVGKALNRIESPEEHRRFSRKLSDFTSDAKRIVHANKGALVYAGGDDVLAFSPVNNAVKCARELHTAFGERFKDEEWSLDEAPLTLSAGIGIGHFLETLEDLLDLARAAEEMAKRGTHETDRRDGLAIIMRPRGGAALSIRKRWGTPDGDASLDRRLHEWVELLCKDKLPDKVAYDLLQMSREYDSDQWPTEGDSLRRALRADARRLLSRKSGSGVTKIAKLVASIETVDDLQELSSEIILARRLATSIDQAEAK